jgi:hypothetical protein
MIRITIAVAARGANMATRLTNESTVNDSVNSCYRQGHGPDCPLKHSENVSHETSAKTAGDVVRKPNMVQKLWLMATLGFLLYPAVGCTMTSGFIKSLDHQEALDDFLIGYRNSAWGAKAWHCRKHRFCNKRYLSDFERGFRDGYASVAAGGNGCVPAVCPQSYWGWQYQAADGQARINAWFEGFPLGVQAAEQDGIGNWSQIGLPMATPAPLPAPMNAMPMDGMTGVAAETTFSDQGVPVLVPTPDPVASPPAPKVMAPTTGTAAPVDLDKAAAKPIEASELKTKAPGLPKPDPAAARSVEVAPKPAAPAPKAEAVVPQPNDDPFGFQ